MAELDYPFLSQRQRQRRVRFSSPLEESPQEEDSRAPPAENVTTSSTSWTNQGDQHLIDATLRGEGYQMISAFLSNDTTVRSQQDCRDRVKALSDPMTAGGILPQLWEWPLKKVRRRRRVLRIGEIPLTDDEHMELVIWQHYNCQGLDPLVFEDERCSEELRKEAANLTKNVDARLLQVAARYWRRKKGEEWRQRSRHVGPQT